MKTDEGRQVPAKSLRSIIVTWFRLALHPATVRRAFFTAIFVGVILAGINHGPALVAGELDKKRLVQICLTFAVPYLVSTVSSVATRSELIARSR